jgi:hypothetical protein
MLPLQYMANLRRMSWGTGLAGSWERCININGIARGE